jgi:hypothetical protein
MSRLSHLLLLFLVIIIRRLGRLLLLELILTACFSTWLIQLLTLFAHLQIIVKISDGHIN